MAHLGDSIASRVDIGFRCVAIPPHLIGNM
jgi:hypothetical protein